MYLHSKLSVLDMTAELELPWSQSTTVAVGQCHFALWDICASLESSVYKLKYSLEIACTSGIIKLIGQF